MDYLYHSANINDGVQPPVRITNSFPPRGIVAKVLSNEQNKAGSLCNLYGNLISSPLSHRHSCWHTSKTKHKDLKNHSNGFSPPPTMTEIKSLTRKTPRFYTVDSSLLKHDSGKILPTVDTLIANSELTGLKEVYQRVCKGNMETLKSLISREQNYQRFAFLQTSYPLRCYKKGRHSTGEEKGDHFDLGDDESKDKMKTKSQKQQSVLVPSPYFRREDQSTRQSAQVPSPYVYSRSKEASRTWCGAKSPIEPTVINLNNKLPELPRNKRLNSRFETKNIRSVRKRAGDGMVAVVADVKCTSTGPVSPSERSPEESPRTDKHILYGKTMVKNEKVICKKSNC